ncbi:hypothetical protein SASPL_143501 [Salvia splendens]|uniref:Uncharacterized protein n=1 Tax=Salvia splendens TaxID=180675 RepID=A0A8X8ZAX1_SALSN|nr:hypothetical protein SASPL_143501 [Salvia splendens]
MTDVPVEFRLTPRTCDVLSPIPYPWRARLMADVCDGIPGRPWEFPAEVRHCGCCKVTTVVAKLNVSFNILISASTVSDTGTGNNLEEFTEMKCKNDTVLSGKWDGLLSVMTTSSSDKEIHRLKFDLKEVVASRRLVHTSYMLFKWSLTELLIAHSQLTSLCLYADSSSKSILRVSIIVPDDLRMIIDSYANLLLICNFIQKIAIELIVESGGGTKSYFLQNACSTPATNDVNSYNLTLGLEEYVSKHGNKLTEACHSCFSTGKNLKVGSGVACSRENHQNSGQVMEAVIIISNVSMLDQSSCSRLYGRRTEVLYFKDFSPCSMPQSSLEALNSIDWKNYGLVLKILVFPQHDATTLPCSHSSRTDRYLTRKALKQALSDLKKRNAGTLLSERAVKICNYAPDLAKTISGLIMSSLDLNFKRECFSLLGLPSPEHEKDIVENCIKDKIISVIATNDCASNLCNPIYRIYCFVEKTAFQIKAPAHEISITTPQLEHTK